MKPLVYEANPAKMPALDEHMHKELRVLMKVENPYQRVNNVIPYDAWMATQEGRLHMQLMIRYIIQPDSAGAKEVARIQRQVQAQGRGTKGRPRQYDARLHDYTINRQLRLFIMDKLIAKALDIDTSEWVAPIIVVDDSKPSEPKDAYDSLCRFEEWSNFRLPRAAWVLFTKTERQELSLKHPKTPREEDGGISFDVYRAMQVAGSVVPLDIAA